MSPKKTDDDIEVGYEKEVSDSEGSAFSDSSDSDYEESLEKPPDKPMTEWVGDDFPNKPKRQPRGLNILLQWYSNGRKFVCKKKPIAEDVEPVCCDGIGGLCGLIFLMLIDIAYVAYCIVCNKLATEDDIRLVWLSAIVWLVILVKICHRLSRLGRLVGGCFTPFGVLGDKISEGWTNFKDSIHNRWQSMWDKIDPNEKTQKKKKKLATKIVVLALMGIFTIICLIFFVILKSVQNLISLSGIVVLLLIAIAISKHPGKINWQPVIGGIFVQLVFAVLTLQTRPGYVVFQFLGDRMSEFLSHSTAGSSFVFGDLTFFAFNVLPVVIFFSSFISVAFHLGIISILIDKPSVVATKVLGTTGPETLNAVANIFVSMTESPLITRPYMHMMTNSELNAIIVNGFASVAGSVLAAYISFGVPANHLLIACVMSAPAALAIAKVIYPETKRAPLAELAACEQVKSPYNNVLEAAMVGAMDSIPIVAGIAANLIAFLSIYDFFNKTLTWLGYRACMTQDLTFEVVFSYLLWPIAFTMGVPSVDCLKIAELIGVKTMLNEFVAFQRLGALIKDSAIYRNSSGGNSTTQVLNNGSWIFVDTKGERYIFDYGILHTDRAEVIATYALCGFANIGSIGIMLGAMVSMLPHRRQDLSRMVLAGMVGGTIACFLTGCFAGLFYEGV
ncbi:Solute carrier family 28 member 3 [Echinococcus granulosus]|uniref:Concentrative Na nucleoside cotransporter n=1 Tax=Echinococcus granulosus TaxID=6210 RepID=U6JCE6_ECHGR|nr:Solute carrier family 28 member 3 [Echinococcus granulosus]EUB60933.1 Solute carrier family 28 member 3 [Echinococcus granulosus]CDS21770.1 concentrative Na nucleoside cotransporter [Echinococcus granulosus]